MTRRASRGEKAAEPRWRETFVAELKAFRTSTMGLASFKGEQVMKICPIAIAVGCPRCALFKVCPVKASLGGYKEVVPKESAAKKKTTAAK